MEESLPVEEELLPTDNCVEPDSDSKAVARDELLLQLFGPEHPKWSGGNDSQPKPPESQWGDVDDAWRYGLEDEAALNLD